MTLIKWSEDKIHRMNVWDMALVKIICILLGLILGAYTSEFIRHYIWFFLIPVLFLYIIAIYRFFIRK
ncbi:MAG: hypothetical protein N3D17_07090 [bacterium]|nr:hypothetical protein [bacterium]